MEFFSWKILLGILGAYLLIKMYNFNQYLKKFLIPYDVRITEDEIENHKQHLAFVVKFGKGYFKRQYFTTIGQMENQNPLNFMDLKKMLALMEIKTFENGYGTTEQDYYFVQSSNLNGTRDYNVKYLTVEDAVIDNLRNSVNQ